jgi:hypothetical protein
MKNSNPYKKIIPFSLLLLAAVSWTCHSSFAGKEEDARNLQIDLDRVSGRFAGVKVNANDLAAFLLYTKGEHDRIFKFSYENDHDDGKRDRSKEKEVLYNPLTYLLHTATDSTVKKVVVSIFSKYSGVAPNSPLHLEKLSVAESIVETLCERRKFDWLMDSILELLWNKPTKEAGATLLRKFVLELIKTDRLMVLHSFYYPKYFFTPVKSKLGQLLRPIEGKDSSYFDGILEYAVKDLIAECIRALKLSSSANLEKRREGQASLEIAKENLNRFIAYYSDKAYEVLEKSRHSVTLTKIEKKDTRLLFEHVTKKYFPEYFDYFDELHKTLLTGIENDPGVLLTKKQPGASISPKSIRSVKITANGEKNVKNPEGVVIDIYTGSREPKMPDTIRFAEKSVVHSEKNGKRKDQTVNTENGKKRVTPAKKRKKGFEEGRFNPGSPVLRTPSPGLSNLFDTVPGVASSEQPSGIASEGTEPTLTAEQSRKAEERHNIAILLDSDSEEVYISSAPSPRQPSYPVDEPVLASSLVMEPISGLTDSDSGSSMEGMENTPLPAAAAASMDPPRRLRPLYEIPSQPRSCSYLASLIMDSRMDSEYEGHLYKWLQKKRALNNFCQLNDEHVPIALLLLNQHRYQLFQKYISTPTTVCDLNERCIDNLTIRDAVLIDLLSKNRWDLVISLMSDPSFFGAPEQRAILLSQVRDHLLTQAAHVRSFSDLFREGSGKTLMEDLFRSCKNQNDEEGINFLFENDLIDLNSTLSLD